MENIILYTTHCPKCKILESKLLEKMILFQKFDNEEAMIEMGFLQSPMLKVDEKLLNFGEAISWIKEIN